MLIDAKCMARVADIYNYNRANPRVAGAHVAKRLFRIQFKFLDVVRDNE